MVATPPGDLAWERALEPAWESFCGGTTPVGAVVTDAADAAIVTEGRGRRHRDRRARPDRPDRPGRPGRPGRPATQRLLTEAATARTPLPNLRSALQGTL